MVESRCPILTSILRCLRVIWSASQHCWLPVDVRDMCDATPLINAVTLEYSEIAHVLLKHGADIFAKDSAGQTAAPQAAMANDTELLALFLNVAGARAQELFEQPDLALIMNGPERKAAADLLRAAGVEMDEAYDQSKWLIDMDEE